MEVLQKDHADVRVQKCNTGGGKGHARSHAGTNPQNMRGPKDQGERPKMHKKTNDHVVTTGNYLPLTSADCLHQIRKHVRATSEPHPNRILATSETMAEVEGEEVSSSCLMKWASS